MSPHPMSLRRSLPLLGIIVVFASCVELTGQRISLHYDPAKDELAILLLHDGIHESPPARGDDGAKQIAEHVQKGNILLLDWPGHIRMDDLQKLVDDPAAPPSQRALGAAALASIHSSALGHYRDPDGRIGAAQIVTISKAKDLVAKVNAALREEVLGDSSGSSTWIKTRERMRSEAKAGRGEWLAIDGHSLRFSFPAHPAEWARNKAIFVKEMLQAWQDAKEGRGNDTRPSFFVQFLALTPFSIEETAEQVSVRLGDPQRSVPLRFKIRDAYNAKLEMQVTASVPRDLDQALASRLLAEAGPPADSSIEALAAWGPPEDSVRTLLPLAGASDSKTRDSAAARLRALSAAWNHAGGLPPAPEHQEKAELYLEAWRGWYRGVADFPTGE